MSTKNPFEIRTELLAMAKDYMDQQYQLNWSMANQALENLNKHSKDYAEQVKALTPKPYTMGELIDKATELYNFVSKK
jgi:hypothetical protein